MKSAITVATGVGICALVLGGAFYVSGMQSAERESAGKVDVHLQRARRLLLQYDAHLALESGLRDELGEDGFILLEEDSGTESTYQRNLKKNSDFLRDALGEAKKAVQANSRSPDAQKMLGMIEFEQGRLGAQQANILRAMQRDVRASLDRRANRLRSLQQDLDVVSGSQIDTMIEAAREEQDLAQAASAEQQAVVDDLQSQVDDLGGELEERTTIASSAREQAEAMERDGLDLNDPAGLMEFRKSYEEQSQRYRLAMSEARALEYGTLDNARIDASGDYLKGAYEPILPDEGVKFTRGLIHVQQDLEHAEARLANLEEAARLAGGSIMDLEAMKTQFSERAARAEAVVADEVAFIEGGRGAGDDEDKDDDEEEEGEDELLGEYPQFEDLDIAIREAEDNAIALFQKAARSFKQASSSASGEPQPFRGQVTALQGEAMLAEALVLVGRGREIRENIRVARSLSEYFNNSEAIDEWQAMLDDEGGAAETLVNEAIDLLQNKAKRDVGGGNWIVAAEIGTAYYILELLDVDMSGEKALKWYDTALESVADKDYASDHVRARNFIRRNLQESAESE